MTILIDLSVAGINTGPFNLYSDADNYATAFALNVTRQQLLDGYPAVVPNGTTNIKLQSLSDICPNDTILPVITTTSTSTTSTTTTLNCSFVVNAQEVTTTTTTTTATPTVLICDQNWTTRNLNVANYSDGTVIPQITDPVEWGNLTTGGWCHYDNNPANEAIYGKLYNWYAVNGIYDVDSYNEPLLRKKLAPTGYHVPTGTELYDLVICAGGNPNPQSYAGGPMKATGTIQAGTGLWNDPNIGATNSTGFTAIPGGYRFDYGPFSGINIWARFWSSTEYFDPIDDIWYGTSVFILNDSVNCLSDNLDRAYGLSVRVIKD